MGTRRTIRLERHPDSPGHHVKKWRVFRGLTQQQLADRVESTTSSISQLERGQQGYSQPMLEAIADALSCEPWDLLHVDPFKDGDVVDMTRLLKNATPEQKAEAIGYVKGLLRSG